jgi:hypothetical protein
MTRDDEVRQSIEWASAMLEASLRQHFKAEQEVHEKRVALANAIQAAHAKPTEPTP